MTDRFSDRVVVVTGGSSGIGRDAALKFATEGAAIALVARNTDRLEAVAGEVAAIGSQVLAVPLDVTDGVASQEAVALIVSTLGDIDILFNNAGVIYRDKTVLDTSEDEWNQTMDVSAKGTFLMSRASIPSMKRSGGGAIVNNASYFGVVGGRGAAAYCAAKGAVVQLTRAMALDHAREGIRVNAVAPGSVDTPMLRGEMEEMGGVESVRAQFEEKHPLGRIADPSEISEAVLFLASDASSFITGTILTIDGGITAG